MPARTVKSRSRKPVKKKSRKPVKKKSRKPVKKKSRKPVKKKSRKPVKKKSRKPVKKKSRKSKSKFKVGSRSRSTESDRHRNMRQASERREGRRQRQQRVRDRVPRARNKDIVFKKHGSLGEGRKLKKKTIPSLFELSAQQLPHVSEWDEESNLHLKYWATEPQQKDLKKIMGADLIKTATTPEVVIEPLTDDEIKTLLAMVVDPEHVYGYLSIEDIRLALDELQEIPDDHAPNQFFHSYSDRLREARANYMHKLRVNLQEVKDDIQEVKKEYESTHDEPFDFERDYEIEDVDGKIHKGTIGARINRQFLDKLALDNYIRSLEIAENYRNDLYNYAYSLIIGLNKFGDDDWIYSDELGVD